MKSQRDYIIDYIHENGSITRRDAAAELGIFELSARIVELERRGYGFEKVNESATKHGRTVKYTRYFLTREPKEAV